MSLLEDLKRQKGLFGQCPNPECGKEFRISDAQLFDATETLPERAAVYLAEREAAIEEGKEKLKKQKLNARTRPATGAESGIIGKVVEKIAPSLPGFPAASSDCRSLFEPIDYIVFEGLSERGEINSLAFVDVKSGKGTLTDVQKQIREVVEAGKVSLRIAAPEVSK